MRVMQAKNVHLNYDDDASGSQLNNYTSNSAKNKRNMEVKKRDSSVCK